MVKKHNIPAIMRRLGLPLALTALIMAACNKKDEPQEIDYAAAQSVAVTKFSIKPNAKVMKDLDSVYFSIDLDHKVIFNADSLPLGTEIDKLVPLITYPATVGKAEIVMTGGKTRTGTVDYTANPSDSIDFTGDVKLTLSTSEGDLSQTYTLKVNVHKSVADSLVWDKEAVAPLPSRFPSPAEQKTVAAGEETVTLVKESNGEYTVARCKNPADGKWTKSQVSPEFTPDIRSLAAVGNTLYILSSDGTLYSSADYGMTWSATDVTWSAIIGEYNSTLLGISGPASAPLFDIYPRPQGFTPTSLPSDFPTDGLSNFTSLTSSWAAAPTGFMTGGARDGHTLRQTWAYDGSDWAKISNTPLPAMTNALIVPYFCYRKTNTSWIQTEYSVWLCMGGTLADGSINPTLYISFDNGVNWKKADQLMQYPDFIRPGYSADAVIRTTPMSADLGAHWKTRAPQRRSPQMRLHYFVDGTDVQWECPYIYLFGGHDSQGRLNDEIRRAVLARLTFAPIF